MIKFFQTSIALLVFGCVHFSCTATKNTVKGRKVVASTTEEVLIAVKAAQAGDMIIVKGGTYLFDKRIDLQTNGSVQHPIILMADALDKERPTFDFQNMGEGDSNQGIILRANYWQIKGIDITRAGDNGLLINGNNNRIEFCSFSQCSDTGLQLDSHASNNLILNCDSYFNADSKIENADGFACKLDVGSGNKFKGCRAWQNLDDGWDGYLKETDSVNTIYENCWAFSNGLLKDGKPSGGDGNGFKAGGSDNKLLKHNAKYIECVSVGNMKNGFDHNSDRGVISLLSCIASDNMGKNLSFGAKNPVSKLIVKNCIVFGEPGSLYGDITEITGNSWQQNENSKAVSKKMFDISSLLKSRKLDGSLPDID